MCPTTTGRRPRTGPRTRKAARQNSLLASIAGTSTPSAPWPGVTGLTVIRRGLSRHANPSDHQEWPSAILSMVKDADIPGASLHTLRHAFGTHPVARGIALDLVRPVMGLNRIRQEHSLGRRRRHDLAGRRSRSAGLARTHLGHVLDATAVDIFRVADSPTCITGADTAVTPQVPDESTLTAWRAGRRGSSASLRRRD